MVVQSDLFNRSRIATAVVCLITSNVSRSQAPGNVTLKRGEAGLPKARLPAATVDAIRGGLQLLLDRV